MIDNIRKEEKQSGIYICGRDIMSIPCIRLSGLIGCSSLMGSTLITFLFTSNPVKAINFGFGAFTITFFPYWIYCRINLYKQMSSLLEVEQAIKQRTNEEYIRTDSLSEPYSDTSLSDILEHGSGAM